MDQQTAEYELNGRKRIFTDETVIDEKNVIQVLSDALIIHQTNMNSIAFLLGYEKGNQPLVREKTVRKDIDIKVCDNIANEVTEFKLAYNWGNPIEYVQSSDLLPTGSDKNKDDAAITMLNNMLKRERKNKKDQELARYVEITGIGYRFIDIKRNYRIGGSAFDIQILNPMFAFVVYANDIYRTPMMGVTFRITKSGDAFYTCYTSDSRYEIKNATEIVNDSGKKKKSMKKDYAEQNPLGMIPIVEYNRTTDRTGCFERQISDMDNINVLVSDFTNDVAQNTQALWHANDVDFPEDENGDTKTPVSNQWTLTYTSKDGKTPFIKPLSTDYDYSGILENIKYRHDRILEKCSVPLRSEPGGGSTGTAMSMSSGWNDAECAACKESLIIEEGELQSIELMIAAIQKCNKISSNSPIATLDPSDVDVHFVRNKTYDMATKANSYATYVGHGINQRDALVMVDATSNIETVVTNSKESFDKYQESAFNKNNTTKEQPIQKVNGDRTQSDLSDQASNSPITGNMVN